MEDIKNLVKIGLIGYQRINYSIPEGYLYNFFYNNLLVNKFKEKNVKMNDIDEYNYFYADRNITIKTGKIVDTTGETIHFANTNFKNISAIAECKDRALENCVKKIKFAILKLEKKIKLIDQKKAIDLAKNYYENHCQNKNIFITCKDRLSYNVGIEDELLTLNVTLSDESNAMTDEPMDIIAIVYFNLITGECDMIEH